MNNQPIDDLPRTRSVTIKKLKSLGVFTYEDLINYFPFRYNDFSHITPIDSLRNGITVTIQGTVASSRFEITRSGKRMQRFTLRDDSGHIDLIWFNQPYLLRVLKIGTHLSVAGIVNWFSRNLVFEPVEYETLSTLNQTTIHTGRIVPVYPETRGLSSKTIREKIWYVMHDCVQTLSQEDLLPEKIVFENNLIKDFDAYRYIHFPPSMVFAQKARARLAFDELFTIQLSAALIKQQWRAQHVPTQFTMTSEIEKNVNIFIESLPFKLTNSQIQVKNEILKDLQNPYPMNRFLEGDVGSGKTVIAAIASFFTYLFKKHTLFMAPTEILAQQHYQTIKQLFDNILSQSIAQLPTVALITGSSKPSKDQIRTANILIGTHALIAKNTKYDDVGLVVIDEQHRFGVLQRVMLKEKAINPHLLTMTATPIPRTVALTLYGELDLSIINELPKGRIYIKSYLVPNYKRNDAYEWIKRKIHDDHVQIFIICPRVEESAVETMKSIKAAKGEYEHLKTKIFVEYRIGLLHGKMKAKEKQQVMTDFKNKKIDILVATSVVEVGIDIPNAAVILIEGADRYGLAQLHQLRGRVGRGKTQSYCFLFTDSNDQKTIDRLGYFTSTSNGIALAEYDFNIRGAGDLFGTKQHGMVNLKIADLHDLDLIQKTKKAVVEFMQTYDNFSSCKRLKTRVDALKNAQVSQD